MSVQVTFTTAVSLLVVPTLWEAIIVLAIKDTMEMEQFVVNCLKSNALTSNCFKVNSLCFLQSVVILPSN